MNPLHLTYGERRLLTTPADFRQHAVYATRRAAKLRRVLNIQSKKSFENHTQEIEASNYDSDPRYGLVLLYLAERDAAKALEVLALLAAGLSRSKEKFVVSKMKRSLDRSKHLLDISFGEQDKIIKMSLQVYYVLGHGLLAARQKKWSTAAVSLSLARVALETLERSEKDSLYREIIDLRLDPVLAVALSHANKGLTNTDALAREVVAQHAEKLPEEHTDLLESVKASAPDLLKAERTKTITEITWSSYTAALHNMDVARAIMKAQEKTASASDSDPALFDPALLAWHDAFEKHEADTERSIGADDNETRDRQILSAYLRYSELFVRVRRDSALAKALKLGSAARESTRLYDMVLDAISAIQDLPGVYLDSSLSADMDSVKAFFTAHKYCVVARVYEAGKRSTAALAVMDRACDVLSATSALQTEAIPKEVLDNAKLEAFQKQLKAQYARVHVLAQFEREQRQNAAAASSVADAVHTAISVGTIGALKNGGIMDIKTIRPVSVKPVFFDIAYGYLGETDSSVKSYIVEQTEVSTATPEEEGSEPVQNEHKKKGFFGLWG